MSELEKLLSASSRVATSATHATDRAKSSEGSKGSSRAYPSTHFGRDRLLLHAGDDWPEIAVDPSQLEAFKAAAETADKIQQGIVPEHYTAATECRRCGPVPIFPGVPAKVAGCPWCFNRHAAPPIPLANVHPGKQEAR